MNQALDLAFVVALCSAGALREAGRPRLVSSAIFTVLSLSVGVGSLHAAPTCEQFKAAIVEGAAKYDAPALAFRLEYVNSEDANVTYWTIATFGDVRAMMSCWHGRVSLEKDSPVSRNVERAGHILCRPVLGGLHHQYIRI